MRRRKKGDAGDGSDCKEASCIYSGCPRRLKIRSRQLMSQCKEPVGQWPRLGFVIHDRESKRIRMA